MLCSFQAPVEGAYYQEAINALQIQNRVTKVPVDLNTSVITAWDLGIRHLQVHLVVPDLRAGAALDRLYRGPGKSLSHYVDFLRSRRRLAVSAIAHTCFHTT